MRDLDAHDPLRVASPEVIEAAMKRAHQQRSEAMRDTCARRVRWIGAGLRALGGTVQRAIGAPAADHCGIAAVGFAPSRGPTAPGWRVSPRSGSWADTVRCEGS